LGAPFGILPTVTTLGSVHPSWVSFDKMPNAARWKRALPNPFAARSGA
jgi:hypothetical protein